MNIQEITKRLYDIGEAILEKTGDKPWLAPFLCLRDDQCTVTLYSGWNGGNYKAIGTAKGETPEAALDAADAIVAALPAPQTAKLHAHMARVADCIDKAHADGIDDEYVTPLRMTVAAMTENLLEGPK